MNDTQQLIHDLRQLGKYSTLEPNWYLLSADKIEELSKRVEVVRCKDCKSFSPNGIKCKRDNLWHDKYDFCSYGERKESV